MDEHAERSNRRIEVAFMAFGLFLFAAAGKLFWLQVVEHRFYRDKAQKMHMTTIEQQFGRGAIYDAKGGKLAVSISTESICVEPGRVKDKASTAAVLAKELGMSRDAVLRRLKSKKSFEYIQRQVDPRIAAAINSRELKGVFTHQEEKRFYPLKETAAHIIGFTNIDNRGLEGIEYEYEKYLRGKIGRVLVKRDARRRPITIDRVNIKKAEAGADIYLTLDSTVQYAAQRELDKMAEKYSAKSGSIIVMNPQDGAILAMGNYPAYDPNEFYKYPHGYFKNRAITDIYEPGSTFKVCAVSAFLEEFPEADPDEYKIHCGNGRYLFFDRYVHDHEKKYGLLSVTEVIKYSSNIGTVQLAMKLRQERLYEEFVKYGFGSLTGIDLPGEVAGILRPVSQWDNTTITSIPYGQEVAVTPIQVAAAYCMLANGGYRVAPHIIRRIEKNGKTLLENRGSRGKRALDPAITQKVVEMLKAASSEEGTGRKAMLSGYTIAGKTGTSQKHKENGRGYAAGKYVASYVGFLPADRPEVLTLVVLDEPRPSYYGGDVAAPVFKEVNQAIVSYLQIPPVFDPAAPAAEESKLALFEMPDFYLKDFSEAKEFFGEKNFRFTRRGYGHYVIAQKPVAGTTVAKGDRVTIFIGDKKGDDSLRVYVPDVHGLTIRKTMEVFAAMGLKVNCVGSGFAVSQEPGPGVAVRKGQKCTVNFGLGDNT